jgi:hypothetical protein
MMTDEMTPRDLLPHCPPGSCLYGEEVLEDDGRWHVAYYVREDSDRIKSLRSNPDVLWRHGLIDMGDVRPVVVMMGVFYPRGMAVYEAWINVNSEHREVLGLLIEQHRTMIHFIGDSGEVERSIQFENEAQSFWEHVQSEVGWRDWTDDDFFAAKNALCDKYSSEELWRQLDAGGNS